MIFVKHGAMSISGTKLMLMAELTTLMNGLINKDVLSEQDLKFCVDTALLSHEELEEKVSEIKEKDDDVDGILDKLDRIAEILSSCD